MSQQQFESQHTERTGQEGQSSNNDPREQSRPSDYMADGQKIYPQRQRRRRGLWALVIIVVILVLLGGSGYITNSVFSKSVALSGQSLQVNGAPTVIINDAAGIVKIQSGSSNTVTLAATAHGSLFSNLNGDAVKMTENADDTVVTISVSEDGSAVNRGNVDLAITLPQKSDIQATVNAGVLDINGVSGKMNLKVDAGTLSFENGTLADASTFNADAGSITFNGLLTSNGNYDFESKAGTINLDLQTNVSYTLDATVGVGHVNNKFGTDTIGSGPYNAHITAHTNAGDINIQQA